MRIWDVPELQWYASKRCNFAMNQWAKSHNLTEVVNIVYTDCIATGIGKYAVIDWSYGYVLNRVLCTWTSIKCQQKLWFCHEYASCASYSNRSTQYLLECLSAKWDWQMCWAGAVITWLKTYAEDTPEHLNFDHMPANAAELLQIHQPVSRNLTPQLTIA